MKQYIVDAFTNKPFSGNPAALIGTFNRELYLIWKILVHNNFFIRGLDMGTILYICCPFIDLRI